MPKLTSITNLFDEQHEIMAWITLAFALGGIATDRLEDWPGIVLVALSLVTMLGSAYFKGISIGPGGLDVK